MKLESIKINNFRSLKNVEWKPGALNIVIGPNGSGKSNLLQLLEYVKASAQGELRKFFQNSGGYKSVAWNNIVSEIRYAIKAIESSSGENEYYIPLEKFFYFNSIAKLSEIEFLDFYGEYLNIFYEFDQDLEYFDKVFYEIFSKNIAQFVGTELDKTKNKFFIRNDSETTYIKDVTGNLLDISKKAIPEYESILSLFEGLFIGNHRTKHFQRFLSSWMIFKDISVGRNSKMRQSLVTSYEKKLDSDGQNLTSVLHTLYTENRIFRSDIIQSMKAAFGNDFEELLFPPASEERIQLAINWGSIEKPQYSSVLSDGTLRFLMLITILSHPDSPDLIAFDEPELGLHPSMFPIIAEYAAEASERSQIIFTTHSPEFLNAFKEKRPTVTVTQLVDGATELKVIEDEELDYWLKKYSLGELFMSGELEEMG